MRPVRRVTACVWILSAMTAGAQAPDTLTKIRISGFVDAYYAYDFTKPSDGERRFTTQPVRHDEVNVNLAWLGITVERPRARARFAMQTGTSVQVNYAAEPVAGSTSGPDVARFIQEAVVGVRLADDLWVDGGVYYSYIGLESWSSADNPTYTRSLVADYTPYYLSGVKLTWTPTARLTAQLHATNGWQNISENNRSKALGGRIDFAVTPGVTVAYANFLGNERPRGAPSVLRVFHQAMVKGTTPTGLQWQGQVDVGHQGRSDWYGVVAIVRKPVTPSVAVVGRVERYADPDQVVLGTGLTPGFAGNGASLGIDVLLDVGVRWRSELRGLRTSDPLFPSGASGVPTRGNAMLVTSLSFGF